VPSDHAARTLCMAPKSEKFRQKFPLEGMEIKERIENIS
jgi:hypothetical protein